MKSKTLHSVKLLLLIPLVMAAGCKSGGKRAPGGIDQQEAGEIVQRIEAMKQVYHLCPSPAEMLSVIDFGDLSFDAALLNPVSNADRYLDTRSTTLALGIYATDLAYCALFGRHEETLNYLEVVRSLAEKARVTGAIDDELVQDARANVADLDSLFAISNQAFINMLFFCERNDRPGTIVMLSAGSFIESLYLAVNLVDDYDDAGYLLQHLTDQKYALENLMVFAESLGAEDENVASVMEDLGPIVRIYEGLEAGSGAVTISTQSEATSDQPKKLVIGGGASSPPLLSAPEFEKLRQETIRLRTRLVEG
jgi:hypothetical protein